MRILTFLWSPSQQNELHGDALDAISYIITRGHQVTIVCAPGRFSDQLRSMGAKVYETDYQSWDSFLASGFLDFSYNLIHVYPGASRVWGMQAQEKLRIPLVITIYDSWFDGFQSWWQNCACVFAVSPAIRQELVAQVPKADGRVYDMPSTVAPACAAAAAGPTTKRDGSLHVLVATHFDMDQAPLVDALLGLWKEQAERNEPCIRWEIAGTGTELDRIRDAAMTLALAIGQNVVGFHGSPSHEALAQLELKCDAAMSSGRSAIQALACEQPVISIGPAGCFGLVTRENFWKAVHCNFGGFGLEAPTSMTNIFENLTNLAAPQAEQLRESANCGALTRSYFSKILWADRLLAHYTRAVEGATAKVPAAPFMPGAEVEYLTRVYAEAQVILEYGSGGSTEIAARMPGKYVMSVESDVVWARALRQKLSGSDTLSRAVVHHVDIGATGRWGRPLDDHAWRDFHAYPNDVWEQRWFRHPDVVLIDGRFRTACLATVLLRAERPVRVLFDDYGVRPLYHQIEEVIHPVQMIGRMAEFHVEPGLVSRHDIGLLIRQFFSVSVHGTLEKDYQVLPPRRGAIQ